MPDGGLRYRERFAGGARQRRIGIVAVARKLSIALGRYLEAGVLPEGAVRKPNAPQRTRSAGASCRPRWAARVIRRLLSCSHSCLTMLELDTSRLMEASRVVRRRIQEDERQREQPERRQRRVRAVGGRCWGTVTGHARLKEPCMNGGEQKKWKPQRREEAAADDSAEAPTTMQRVRLGSCLVSTRRSSRSRRVRQCTRTGDAMLMSAQTIER